MQAVCQPVGLQKHIPDPPEEPQALAPTATTAIGQPLPQRAGGGPWQLGGKVHCGVLVELNVPPSSTVHLYCGVAVEPAQPTILPPEVCS